MRAIRVIRKRLRALFGPFRYPARTLRAAQETLDRIKALENMVIEQRREARTLHVFRSLPSVETWRDQPPLLPEALPGGNVLPFSTGCREAHFAEPWFSYWTDQFKVKLLYHRKLWEYVFICQALHERGALMPGARGLGFGVGSEPLSPWFAAHGCHVTATDMSAAEAQTVGWVSSAQHGLDPDRMQWPAICTRDAFDQNVEVRVCDMNNVDPALIDFDFCWSSCALEHLGSIEQGLAFIERSLACLKPGGWAVHTTEFNLTSNSETVDNAETVLFRRQDLEALAARLEAKGHRLAPLDFDPGFGVIDNFIDVPPYRNEPCLKIALMGYGCTSFGLIVQRCP